MIFNLGQVAIVSMGEYSSGTTYQPLQVVSHNSGSYLCIKENTIGKEPGVASGWRTYWQSMGLGVKSLNVASNADWSVTFTVTYSDNTTSTFTVNLSPVPSKGITTAMLNDGAVTAAKLGSGAVTAAKLGSDVTYETVGIHVVTQVPTSSSADGIYLVTG